MICRPRCLLKVHGRRLETEKGPLTMAANPGKPVQGNKISDLAAWVADYSHGAPKD